MKQLFPRGKRIRPTDKDLVFHTALAALFPVFLPVSYTHLDVYKRQEYASWDKQFLSGAPDTASV